MELIVNGTAIARSSLGARRYYEAVRSRLDLPGTIEVANAPSGARSARIHELFDRGRAGAVYWSPCHRGPLRARNHVVTVLDCINVEYTYLHDWRLPLLRGYLQALFSNATAIVGISHATKNAILRNFNVDPDKITVIAGPTDIGLQPATDDDSTRSDHLEMAPFVLMIANGLPHKNTGFAGRAFAASDARKRGVTLKVIGSMTVEGMAACVDAGIEVQQHKGIEDRTLGQWMRHAVFLLSPSLDEGLNLPIAEAISLGTRVICSDIPVHREFYDGFVEYFDPNVLESAVQAMNTAFEGAPVRLGQKLLDAFSVATVAAKYGTLFKTISNNAR